VVGDENLFQILVYDRLADTPPGARFTEPKRVIAGPDTGIEFVCGLYVDQPSGDIYAIHADTAAVMQVFTREQQGNVQPVRELHTGGEARGRGFAVDSENEELFIASQHNSAVAVWHKYAEGEEPPIRLLQGDRTLLANPSGLALDKRNDLLFVANQGQVSSRSAEGVDPELLASNRPLGIRLAVRGSGRFLPPSINVYHRTASGDTPPLRVIGGPRTQLNWPAAIVVDERTGELFVANDTGNSVLVFRADASGDVAPIRVLKGPDTGLDSPAGVFVDAKNDELWVANYGNHSLTVFSTTADGNTAPLRTIRSGPAGNRALMIGNPGAVAYDSKREQILAPN
ncbi:MAG: beta-propeller fold lactonase family protein, partial [Gemmatimonadales bacterium]